LTFEPDPDSVKLNQQEQAQYLGRRSFSSKVIVPTQSYRQTHRPDWLLYLDH